MFDDITLAALLRMKMPEEIKGKQWIRLEASSVIQVREDGGYL